MCLIIFIKIICVLRTYHGLNAGKVQMFHEASKLACFEELLFWELSKRDKILILSLSSQNHLIPELEPQSTINQFKNV